MHLAPKEVSAVHYPPVSSGKQCDAVAVRCSAVPLRCGAVRCGAVLCLCCVLLGSPSQAFALTRQCSLTQFGSQPWFSPNGPGDANHTLRNNSLISSQSRNWASWPSGGSPEVSS